jgi:hypothetical protein
MRELFARLRKRVLLLWTAQNVAERAGAQVPV